MTNGFISSIIDAGKCCLFIGENKEIKYNKVWAEQITLVFNFQHSMLCLIFVVC